MGPAQVGEGSNQCWTYSACATLYRQIGLAGTLMAWAKDTMVCRLSNAELCWHVTKRREFLTAALPLTLPLSILPSCLHQSLFEQCDQKLMLGGTSVEACGQCKYALLSASVDGTTNFLEPAPSASSPGNSISVVQFGPETVNSSHESDMYFGSGLSWSSEFSFLYDLSATTSKLRRG